MQSLKENSIVVLFIYLKVAREKCEKERKKTALKKRKREGTLRSISLPTT